MKAVDIPQANNLDQVREVVHAVAAGATTLEAVRGATTLSARHVGYHVHAARVLGWLDLKGAKYELSLTAAALLDTEPGTADEAAVMQAALTASPLLQALAPDLMADERPGVTELAERIGREAKLAPATALRRAQTLLAWRDRLLGAPTRPAAPAAPLAEGGAAQPHLWRLRVTDLLGLSQLDLHLPTLAMVHGPAGAGRTSLAEALRLLSGVGLGLTLGELLGERRNSSGAVEWTGLAGGPSLAVHRGAASFTLEVELRSERNEPCTLQLEVAVPPAADPYLVREEMTVGDPARVVYAGPDDEGPEPDTHARVRRTADGDALGPRVPVLRDQPLLTQIAAAEGAPRHVRDDAARVARSLAAIRAFRPDPQTLRQPGRPGPLILGPQGEGFPSALEVALQNEAVHAALVARWAEVLGRTPRGFTLLRDPMGRIIPHEVLDDAWALPAAAWSDTALVLAAATTVFATTAPHQVLVWDDADAYLPPEILVELLEDAESRGGPQVVLLVRHEHTARALAASRAGVARLERR
jgi:hypothetical protein